MLASLSRTVLYVLLNAAFAVAAAAGVEIPEELKTWAMENLNWVVAGALFANALAVWVLRIVTKAPMSGLLFRQER